jgi:UDPglucose--hexose-1-phosphate uridylyltransferase
MTDEIRKDLFGRSVIISTRRSKRPDAFISKHGREKACPFCPGSESKTEKTVMSLPSENKWKVRVFKNKFPVLHTRTFKPIHENHLSSFAPCGSHEILVETEHHDREYFSMPVRDITLVIKALKARYEELMKIPDVNYVTIFKNKGERAGASLAHPHMQIIASPLFPHKIAEEMRESEDFFKKEKQCGHCEMMGYESSGKKRMVASNRDWMVMCPFTSKWPYQATILPRRHFSNITQMEEPEMTSLASIIRKLFHAYSKLFDDPPYNIMYHNFPESEFWHFHICVYPRLVTHAGFEFFGLNVNITSPEQAARNLRKAIR